MGAESFTVLAILEARDRASEIFAKVDESLDRFSETAQGAADTARAAGSAIDESLLQTASGADALDVADARVAASQARAAQSAQALADAERELLAAQSQAAAAADGDAAAQDRLLAANTRLTSASKDNAAAQKALSDAQKTQADTAVAAAAKNDEAAASTTGVKDASEASAVSLGSMGKIAGITALGVGIAGAVMVKAAGNFQDSTTHLVTDAGESAKNLAMVQAGILNVSTATGQSAASITNAMYHIESGGLHGATGIGVLTVAAEGARVGGADLDTVSKTLVGTLNAYYGATMNAGNATQRSTQMMNEIIATVGSGDMRMQDLASSMSAVAPLAAKVGLSFAQVGGAIATMTAQGMSANQATQDLAHTIRSLTAPTNTQITEMNQLGINAQDVAQHLGKSGLTGTLQYLTQTILAHMGKSGTVLMNAFTQSTTAGQDLQVMLKNMPPQFQSLAKGFMSGQVSAQQWRTELLQQTPVNQKLMQQFATLYEKSHSFNSLLAAGGPAAQTYTAALYKVMGGATGLNTALMLTGKSQGTFAANVNTIQAAADRAGSSVSNWSTIQGTFNFKMAQARTAVENTGIAIGTAILPAVTSLMQAVSRILVPVAEFAAHNRTLVEVLFIGVGALAATIAIVSVAAKTYKMITGTIDTVKTALKAVGLISKETAGTQAASADEAAGATDEAAGSLDRYTVAAHQARLASEEAGAAAETAAGEQEESAAEAAAANDEAAAESSGSWILSAAQSAAGWVTAGAKAAVAGAKFLAVKAAQLAVAAATRIWSAAQMIFNAVMDANPIMLVVIAIAALAAGIAYAWTHFATFRKIVEGVFDWLSGAVKTVVDFVKTHWLLLVEIFVGPLALVVVQVVKHWNDIKKWFQDGVHAVESILSWFGSLPGRFRSWLGGAASAVSSAGSRVLSWFEALPGKVLAFLSGLPGRMLSAGKNIVEGLIHGIESMFGSVGSVVGSLAGKVLGGVTHLFGIASPSSVMAGHGEMLGAGFAQGIISSTPRAIAAMQRMGMALRDSSQAAVRGMIDGMQSMSAEMTVAVQRLAALADQAVKDRLQISSPSKVMLGHGQMVGLGLAQGILAAAPLAANAAKSMTSGVLGAMTGLSAGSPGVGSTLAASALSAVPGAGAAGGTTVNLYVTGNTVMTDSDVNVLVDKIGRKLATTILPSAGRKTVF